MKTSLFAWSMGALILGFVLASTHMVSTLMEYRDREVAYRYLVTCTAHEPRTFDSFSDATDYYVKSTDECKMEVLRR